VGYQNTFSNNHSQHFSPEEGVGDIKLALRFDFLHAKHAVDTRFFHPAAFGFGFRFGFGFFRGGSFPGEGDVGPGTMGRYCCCIVAVVVVVVETVTGVKLAPSPEL